MATNPQRGRGRGGGRGGYGEMRGSSSERGRGQGGFRGGGGSRGRGHGAGPPAEGQAMQLPTRGLNDGQDRGPGGIYLDGQPVEPPDIGVTQLEDRLVRETRDKMFDGMPGRRSYGTKGRAIVLRTNYFPIDLRGDVIFYRYNLEIDGSITKPQKRRLFVQILADPKLDGVAWASDYADFIVTTSKLELWERKYILRPVIPVPTLGPESPTQAVLPTGPAPDFVEAAQKRNRFNCRLTQGPTFSLSDMIMYLRSTSASAEYGGRVDIIPLLNMILCKPANANMRITNAGSNRFYPFEGHPGMEKINLGAGLQAMRGYFSSVRPAVGRLLVNLNVTSGAFYPPVPLQNLLGLFRSWEQCEIFIQRVKVKVTYPQNDVQQLQLVKIKTIAGFAKDDPPTVRVKRCGNAKEVKFRYTDNKMPTPREREVTVFDYFQKERGITLKRPDLPVINCGTRKDPQYIPAEICTVEPGQPYKRLLNGDQTREMLAFAARHPKSNAISISGTPQNPGAAFRVFHLKAPPGEPDKQTASVHRFGFGVVTDMVSVPGRVLAAPQVKYGSRATKTRDGSWNLVDVKFSKPGKFARWSAVVLSRPGRPGLNGDPEALFDQLARTLAGYGLGMGERFPTRLIALSALTVDGRRRNDQAIREMLTEAENDAVPMLLVVLPELDRWLYARIKYYGDVVHGIHTICVIGSKMQKPRGQEMYMGNLALKFNIKGGGINHTVDNTMMKPLDNDTMVVGIDVTHPSPGSSQGAPSISCVVASIDGNLAQWPGSIRTQAGRQEMVQGLQEMAVERLNLWRKYNERLPSKILLYRDGVSEGQYQTVLREELPCFEKSFSQLYGAKKNWPKMAIIIVGKRHHTRFYPTRSQDADTRSWNPLPGTVVDRQITGRILHEFYLQAHQGLQGTARPAHYVVIKDDIGFQADALEQITHQLCYLFNRATKAVSICPPAYYADLLCERGRCYLFGVLAEDHASDSSAGTPEWTRDVHRRLEDSTFYI